MGELCELFQFKNEDDCFTGLLGWKKEGRDKLSQVKQVLIAECGLCGHDLVLFTLWPYPISRMKDENFAHYDQDKNFDALQTLLFCRS